MDHAKHDKECEHEVAYCKKCDVTYCKKCGKEWGKKETVTIYPHCPQPPSHRVPWGPYVGDPITRPSVT